MSDSSRFEFQTKMLEKGAEEVMRQVGRLDDILFKIKAAAIAVWVALIGWSFTVKNNRLIPLGFIVIIGFWCLEGIYRGVLVIYLKRATNITGFLNDSEALDSSFKSLKFPPNMVYAVAGKETILMKFKRSGLGMVSPSVITTYLFLAFINILIWMAN